MLYKRRRERPRSLLTAISDANIGEIRGICQIRKTNNGDNNHQSRKTFRFVINRQTAPKYRQQQTGPSYLYRMKYVLYAILAYIIYQFIFKLVIPVYLASRKIKKGFKEMQSRMQEHMQQQQGYTAQPSSSKPEPKTKAGDYIDFEEVK